MTESLVRHELKCRNHGHNLLAVDLTAKALGGPEQELLSIIPCDIRLRLEHVIVAIDTTAEDHMLRVEFCQMSVITRRPAHEYPRSKLDSNWFCLTYQLIVYSFKSLHSNFHFLYEAWTLGNGVLDKVPVLKTRFKNIYCKTTKLR